MLSICIQAGGQSRRMGRNKALIPFSGQPLIKRIVERVRPVAAEILVIANDPALFEFLDLPVVPDRIVGMGALGGVYTALSAAHHPFVAPLACDMPFLSPDLLVYEVNLLQTSGADVVIPESESGLEPLHAVYRRETCLPLVEASLSRGKLRLVSWLDQAAIRVVSPEEVEKFDPKGIAFMNVNTPEDFAAAEALAGALKG